MKLDEITSQTISKVSNKELSSLHRRIHQIAGNVSKFKQSIDKLVKLEKVHSIVMNEMNKRKFKHVSFLPKQEEKNMSKSYLDFLLEETFNEGTALTIPSVLNNAEVLLEKKKARWIQKAVGKPGTLHTALGVPQDEKIPEEKLEVKPSDSPKMKKRKILAKTLKKITRKRTGKGEED